MADAFGMTFLGQGSSRSLPKHIEKEKLVRPGLPAGRNDLPAALVLRPLFPADPREGGLSWYREQSCQAGVLLRCSIACRVNAQGCVLLGSDAA